MVADRRPAGRRVVAAVAAATGHTVDALVGRRRPAALVAARQMAMWLCVRRCGMSLAQTGAVLARDHSTVLHGVRRIDAARSGNPVLAGYLDGLAREAAAIPEVRR